VIDTILSAYHFPVGMEMFGADDAEQWEIIQDTIKGSDYYIIIIGHRYGSLPVDQELSYTEREYDYARELGIPILAFIRERNASTRPDERESDPLLVTKLEAFVQKAQANKMCNFWNSADELATQVTLAVHKVFERIPRIGWVRGNEVAGPEVLAELAELSSENRKLKQKLAEYEKLFSNRVPDLGFSIFDGGEIELVWKPDIHFKWPERIDFDNVPEELHEYITREDIESYNSNIPEYITIKEQLDTNNVVINRSNALSSIPVILNNGTSPASDIYVKVTFPDFVRVMWQEDVNEYHHVDMSYLESPVERAQMKHQMKNTAIGRMMASDGLFSALSRIRQESVFTGLGSLSVSNKNLRSLLRSNRSGDINDNVLEIALDKLPHTRKTEIDEISIIPTATGEGDVQVSVICSEFERPLLYTQHIKVV